MSQKIFIYEDYELLHIGCDDLVKLSAARFQSVNIWADANIRRAVSDWQKAGLTFGHKEKIGIIMPTQSVISKVYAKKKLSFYATSDDIKSLYMNIIAVKDEQDLLLLAKNYGLLGGTSVYNLPTYIDNCSHDDMHFDFVSTELLMEEIKQIKSTYDLWRRIQKDEIFEIKDQLESDGREFETLNGRKHHDLKELAVYKLNGQLHRPKGVTLMRIVGSKLERQVLFANLIELAYAQLLNAIFKDLEIKQCKHCELDFEVSHPKQQFCPPIRGKRNSTCQNTYNQREKRKRKKKMGSDVEGAIPMDYVDCKLE